MEPIIADNNNENRGQGDQLDFIPKKFRSSNQDESGSASSKAHKPRSRIPRSRKYISTIELERQNATAPPPSGESISDTVAAPPPNGESASEGMAKCQKKKHHRKSIKERQCSICPVTLYFLGFELMKVSESDVEGNLFYLMLHLVDRFVDRISSSVLVSMGIFLMIYVIFAYDFAEPIARIQEAVGDLFNDRSRS
ncbi:uncharacterized protein LOC6540692 [Drosophila erecta]|uniref:Uncharacterized protein n=1 Tax=Drosophila erecta TaxID=7220 RepID=B3N4V5_DROER|nr:uncharacterized protein LOC6540692 [Drosophila erecta]EDV57857.1 uncharacterized protein Dere_GG24305 [Drosophila erecta]